MLGLMCWTASYHFHLLKQAHGTPSTLLSKYSTFNFHIPTTKCEFRDSIKTIRNHITFLCAIMNLWTALRVNAPFCLCAAVFGPWLRLGWQWCGSSWNVDGARRQTRNGEKPQFADLTVFNSEKQARAQAHTHGRYYSLVYRIFCVNNFVLDKNCIQGTTDGAEDN